MKKFRARIALLVTMAAMALGVGMLIPAPAQAYIGSCTGHVQVGVYTTAGGNVYRIEGHICLDVRDGTNNTLNINGRYHWHCTRNGADWDGCRVRSELVMEWRNSAGTFVNATSTLPIVEPASGYFANSQTRVSFTDSFADGVVVRASAEEEDSARILLADNTSVVINITDQKGQASTVCTIDPC